MPAISSAVRGKSGVKLTSWGKTPSAVPKSFFSSAVTGVGGFVKWPRVPASSCRPSRTRPSSAVSVAKAPGMPPLARISALFWNMNR